MRNNWYHIGKEESDMELNIMEDVVVEITENLWPDVLSERNMEACILFKDLFVQVLDYPIWYFFFRVISLIQQAVIFLPDISLHRFERRSWQGYFKVIFVTRMKKPEAEYLKTGPSSSFSNFIAKSLIFFLQRSEID